MLRALNRLGDVLAYKVERKDGPFYCPACEGQVTLKQGRKVIAHFAHLPKTNCSGGEVESEEHKQVKKEIYEALILIPGVTHVRMEYYLRGVKADIYFVLRGEQVVIEVQISKISRDDIDRRTIVYTKRNISILWMPLLSLEVLGERYAAKDWERYLHTMYFERLYYWKQGLELLPVQYGQTMLAPSRYNSERPSKRYVSASLCDPVMITDLAPVWRNRWRDMPRAKLWCEPLDKR